MWGWKFDPEKSENDYCDLDYVAKWILDSGYGIKTTLERVTIWVVNLYHQWCCENNKRFYSIEEDTRQYPLCLMIHTGDVAAFVEDSGGLKEFDHYV